MSFRVIIRDPPLKNDFNILNILWCQNYNNFPYSGFIVGNFVYIFFAKQFNAKLSHVFFRPKFCIVFLSYAKLIFTIEISRKSLRIRKKMFAKFRIFSQKFSLAGNPDHKWLPVSKMLLMVFWIKDEQENGFNEKYNYIYIYIWN